LSSIKPTILKVNDTGFQFHVKNEEHLKYATISWIAFEPSLEGDIIERGELQLPHNTTKIEGSISFGRHLSKPFVLVGISSMEIPANGYLNCSIHKVESDGFNFNLTCYGKGSAGQVKCVWIAFDSKKSHGRNLNPKL
jgi:hypothetical protein